MVDAAPVGDVLALGGFAIRCETPDSLADDLIAALAAAQRRRVFFANTNFVVQCQPLRARMRDGSVRIVNDGIGMDLAAMWLHGRRFPSNMNGTDFIPFLCARSRTPLRFFLVGAKPGVAARAADALRDFGQQVVGVCDGYAEFAAARDTLVATIDAAQADVVLVAFGNPLQETWILDHGDALAAPLVFGVGALFHFLSGDARRAPGWIRALHLEWLYRMLREPRRLARRYTVELFVFFRLCLRAARNP